MAAFAGPIKNLLTPYHRFLEANFGGQSDFVPILEHISRFESVAEVQVALEHLYSHTGGRGGPGRKRQRSRPDTAGRGKSVRRPQTGGRRKSVCREAKSVQSLRGS